MAGALSGLVITSPRQSCVLLAVGACIASCMHSRMTSRPTGRVRSRRLRTDRVVLSSSSTVAISMLSLPGCSEVDRAGLIDAEHAQRASEAKEHRDTEGEIEDFLIGEDFTQPSEERVVDRCVVVREPLGVFDGKTLARRVAGIGRISRDVLIQLWC